MKKLLWLSLVALTAIALCLPTAAIAKKGSDSQRGKALGKQVKAIIKADKRFYNEGDSVNVSVKFSRGSELLANEIVDAYIVVLAPDSAPQVFRVDPDIGPKERRFVGFEFIAGQEFPAGKYQLGIILTVPGGNPMDLGDWYNGFRGAKSVASFTVDGDSVSEDTTSEEYSDEASEYDETGGEAPAEEEQPVEQQPVDEVPY